MQKGLQMVVCNPFLYNEKHLDRGAFLALKDTKNRKILKAKLWRN